MLWSSSGRRIFALKKTRASGRNVGKVFNPVVKLVLENQPFLMPEPAEKPSLHTYIYIIYIVHILYACTCFRHMHSPEVMGTKGSEVNLVSHVQQYIHCVYKVWARDSTLGRVF